MHAVMTYDQTNPLMHPVQYGGYAYFTSQYFHAQYLANSPHGGKFRRHHDFLRALRGIETYAEYIRQKDIVEITWHSVKSGVDTEAKQHLLWWMPLFQTAGYRPLTLLNTAAQAALSHHPDDELSK